MHATCELLRAIGAGDVDVPIVAVTRDADSPRAAADFAVLDEAALEIRLEVDLHLFAAVRARHEKTVFHTSSFAAGRLFQVPLVASRIWFWKPTLLNGYSPVTDR